MTTPTRALLAASILPFVSASAGTNLLPYKPNDLAAPLIVETSTGESGTVSWAVINRGDSTAAEFLVRLYLDGAYVGGWRVSSLRSNYYVAVRNHQLPVTLAPGRHKLELVADPTSRVRESNEDDNTYKVRFEVEEEEDSFAFKMPLPGGYQWLCTANAGDRSQGTHVDSNYYSLDLVPVDYPKSNVPILAMHSGKVVEICSARNTNLYGTEFGGLPKNGYFVRIDADEDDNKNTGLVTVYCHFSGPPMVKMNDRITKGQQLGYMGKTGQATGKHLHVTFKLDGGAQSRLQDITIEGTAIEDFRVGRKYKSSQAR